MLSRTSCCSAGPPSCAQGRISMPVRRQAGTQVGPCWCLCGWANVESDMTISTGRGSQHLA